MEIQYRSKVETNAYNALRVLASAAPGGIRPNAVISILGLILINLINLLVLGLIILA